ncbi:hypothetical protein [Roseateles sp.]|uniref:hypothetical protein n=1 Tax=Roseateles sp. TaxID=1971397 RepID=UPI0039EC037F
MTLRASSIAALLALLMPVLLLVARPPNSDGPPSFEPRFLVANWLYLAAPQLVVLTIAAIYAPARRHFVVPALAASALLVAAFQAWSWFFVPAREGGLAWILYIPLWAALPAVVAGIAWLQQRRTNEL